MTTEPSRPDGITPSQTVGPFFAYVLTPHAYPTRPVFSNDLVTPDASGGRIRVEGYILDGDGEPIIDAMVEIWQADGEGRYATSSLPEGANEGFRGYGRTEVSSDGLYSFSTVKPGAVYGPGDRLQAPHISVGIFARGLLRRLATRIYLEGEPGNEDDPILALVPAERRATLIARRTERGGEPVYTFNIRLQGENETVFFDH